MRRLRAILWAVLLMAPVIAAQSPTTSVTTGPATRPATTSASQPATQAATTQEAEAAAREAARRRVDAEKVEQDKTTAQLNAAATDAETAGGDLSALRSRLNTLGMTRDVNEGFWGLEPEIRAWLAENEGLVSGVPTLETLSQQRAVLEEYNRQLDDWINDLDRRQAVLKDGLDKLTPTLRNWETRQRSLNERLRGRAGTRPATAAATRAATRPGDAAGQILQRLAGTVTQYTELRNEFEYEATTAAELVLYIKSTEQNVADALNAVTTKQRTARDLLLKQDSPPLWNALLRPMELANDVTEQGKNSFNNQWQSFTGYLGRQGREMLMHALGVGGLAAVLIWLRRRTRQWVGSDPHLLEATRVFQTPIATAITASMILTPWIYIAAPRLFWGVLGTAALIPTLIVLRPLTERSLRPLLYGLAVAIFVNLLLGIVASLPLVYRALQLGQMGGAAVFFLWFLRIGRGVSGDPDRAPLRRGVVICCRFGLAITAFAALANVFGYVGLARLIGNALLTSAYLGVLLDTSVSVADAVLLGLSHVKPLSVLGMVQRHRPLILKRLHLLLMALAVGLWGFFTLEALSIRQPVFSAARAVWYFPHAQEDFVRPLPPTPMPATATQPAKSSEATTDAADPVPVPIATPTPLQGGDRETLLSLGGVASFVLSIVAAIYAARFIAFVLDEDVYPQLNLPRGMPYAITTLLRYVVWAIGFSLAIYNLGFQDLTKLTILASAFSIGLGFGLQNIVQNFVGGLILLFERPVQVGDVIEIEGVSGVVSRIGIRASVIRTPLAAEIILPNGTLISGRVINWTLSNRQRGVELAITVAAGVEPQRMIGLLTTCARQLPLVAAYPAPQAYFVDFSGGGLKFEVRAWTNRFEDWTQVRSELAVAINAMLVKENVALK